MIIRKATVGDVDGIMNLLFQVAEIHHKGRPDIFKAGCSKYSNDELVDIINNSNTPVLVAVDNKKIVGHAFCEFKQTGTNGVLVDRKSLYIDDICIDSVYRGNGIGTQLCNKVVELATENNCDDVTLNVWCLNKNAVAFYKSLGFNEQKIVMEKVL